MSNPVMVAVYLDFLVSMDDGSDLDDRAEQVMDHLVSRSETDDVLDSAVTADKARSVLTIEATVEGGDVEEAIAKAMSAVREAVHACDGSTPGWPSHEAIMTQCRTEMVVAV